MTYKLCIKGGLITKRQAQCSAKIVSAEGNQTQVIGNVEYNQHLNAPWCGPGNQNENSHTILLLVLHSQPLTNCKQSVEAASQTNSTRAEKWASYPM